MRVQTTVRIESAILAAAKTRAEAAGQTFTVYLERALQASLQASEPIGRRSTPITEGTPEFEAIFGRE